MMVLTSNVLTHCTSACVGDPYNLSSWKAPCIITNAITFRNIMLYLTNIEHYNWNAVKFVQKLLLFWFRSPNVIVITKNKVTLFQMDMATKTGAKFFKRRQSRKLEWYKELILYLFCIIIPFIPRDIGREFI